MKEVKKILRWAGISLLILFSLILLYGGTAFLLQFFPLNSSFREKEEGYPVYIADNGVHTDIIIPVENELVNWKNRVNFNVFEEPKNYSHIGFGWGDSAFYINTPSWDDLDFPTAFNSLFIPTQSAMHVTLYKSVKATDQIKTLRLSKEQYLKINREIWNWFRLKKGNPVLIKAPDFYSSNDRFFSARGKYHLFKTCNVWTNIVLRESGIPTPLWAPFSFNIMEALPEKK